MEANRAGEQARAWKRRTRFYNKGLDWFFHTREGASIGPFEKLSEAVEWAEDYVAYIPSAPILEEVVFIDRYQSVA